MLTFFFTVVFLRKKLTTVRNEQNLGSGPFSTTDVNSIQLRRWVFFLVVEFKNQCPKDCIWLDFRWQQQVDLDVDTDVGWLQCIILPSAVPEADFALLYLFEMGKDLRYWLASLNTTISITLTAALCFTEFLAPKRKEKPRLVLFSFFFFIFDYLHGLHPVNRQQAIEL